MLKLQLFKPGTAAVPLARMLHGFGVSVLRRTAGSKRDVTVA